MHRALTELHPSPIPPDPALPSGLGCADGAGLGERRAALEAWTSGHAGQLQAFDAPLLRLRELELCEAELPPIVGGVRRARLIGSDAATATWAGWTEPSGERAVVRILHPRWRKDPVIRRRIELGVRLATGIPGLVAMRFAADDEHPHVRYAVQGLPLVELLPAEAPPEPLPLARWLASSLLALQGLHRRGLRAGRVDPELLLLGERRAVLLWLDPLELPAAPLAEDLRQLAATLLQLDPGALHPVGQLLQPWLDCPPEGCGEAVELFKQALADELAAARHALQLRGRATGRGTRAAQLHRACLALARCVSPPPARCCLRADADRSLHLLVSDGRTVRGGVSARVPPAELPLLYSPERGLDAGAARALLRAWARREDGDEAARRDAQSRWEGCDEAGGALARWLSAASRLRCAQLLLAHRLRRA